MPTFLLHGFTGHAESWAEIEAAASPPTVFYPITLHGHDPTLREFPIIAFDEEVDRVAALVRARVQGPVRVCGYSMGGRVALSLLVRHPSLFSSAIIISANPGVESDIERASRAAADEKWCARARESVDEFTRAWDAQAMFESQKLAPEASIARQRALRSRHSGAGLDAAMRSLGLASMPNLWPDLPRIAVRTTLVVGSLDHKFRRLNERMVGLMPNAELRVVDGVGHNVVLEAPSAIASLLARDG